METPKQETVQQMLDDIESVTKSRFYEDPDPIASPIDMFRMPEGEPGGESFDKLTLPEMFQVLGDYVPWDGYLREGVTEEQVNQIFQNIIDELPHSRWLENTGLSVEPSFDEMLSDSANRGKANDKEEEIER
jgi:hypothetical protein